VGTTQDRLRKAEALFKELFDNEIKDRHDISKSSPVNQASPQSDSGKKSVNQIRQAVHGSLRHLRLGMEQIQKKDLMELKNAIIMLNACIQRPNFYLGVHFENEPGDDISEAEMMSILIERKKNLLERYCTMVSRVKVRQIQKILDALDNEPARKAIDKLLIQLLIKDQFILEEFRSLGSFSIPSNSGSNL
jgi:hypothetical protein